MEERVGSCIVATGFVCAIVRGYRAGDLAGAAHNFNRIVSFEHGKINSARFKLPAKVCFCFRRNNDVSILDGRPLHFDHYDKQYASPKSATHIHPTKHRHLGSVRDEGRTGLAGERRGELGTIKRRHVTVEGRHQGVPHPPWTVR